jgi:uncharacterized membrane protein
VQIFDLLTTEIRVLLISMLPIIELRGAIPVGMAMGMSAIHAFITCYIGSLIPVPILLFGIRPVFQWLKGTPIYDKIIHKLIHKTLNRSYYVDKYGFWGLMLFVAIPLPGTGIWTGTLAAVLLDIRFKTAFPAIAIGNLIAGIVVMTLSHGAFSTFGGM